LFSSDMLNLDQHSKKNRSISNLSIYKCITYILVFYVSYLIKTVLADLTLLAICQGFGFVGGQIFPTMFAGYLCGIVAHDRYNVAFDVAVPCLMCAVPCAFVPTPFTFVFLVAMLFGMLYWHTFY
jgi:H+/Cl- antiporter ClcA